MNKHTAELLEQHFDTAFAAPDGIKKLRELILTLAMQGKLVPQDPSNQPASELLKEIEAEKQRLVKAGKIKKPKPLPPVSEEEKPYALPQGWEWVRLQCFSDYNGRQNIDPSQIDDDVWLLDLEDIEKETSRLIYRAKYCERESKSTKSTFRKGDVLYGKLRPYLDKVLVADSDGVCTTEIVPVVPTKAVTPEFLRWLLKRSGFLHHVNSLMYGVKMPRLGTDDAIRSVHPIPPVNEQRRIVAKIDELMSRCDELEKLRTAQQEQRLTVHAAAIKQLLNITEPDQHQRAQTFLAEHFGELYTVKENVAELRKAILQLAVMGKLVPQDPDDQPASELLKEIEAKKQRLVKEGKIKNPKPLPPVNEEEKPYALPQGWEWVRLGEIGIWKSGSTPSRSNAAFYGGGIPWVKSGEVKQGRIYRTEETITQTALDKCSLHINDVGSVLVAMYGANIGEVGILEIRAATNQAVCACKTYGIFNERYLVYLITSLRPYFLNQGAGAAQPNISREKIIGTAFPFPPLQEQNRIVAKIDDLMALCDTLDRQIEVTSRKQNELLNAVVHAQSQAKAELPVVPSSATITNLTDYRAAIGCYALGKLANAQYFGRTAAAKVLYLAQAHVGLDLYLQPEREAAGPLDKWIYDFEREGQGKHWFEVNEKTLTSGHQKTEYRCLPALAELASRAESVMAPEQKAEFDRLIHALADKTTEEVEIIATLFAVWNDFLIDGTQPTDEQIITDLRENWHQRKARFTPAKLGQWLGWLRTENFVPRGLLPRTVQQSSLAL